VLPFPDIPRDRSGAEPQENRHVLQQRHGVRPRQAGAQHDEGGGAQTHPVLCAQLEGL